VFGDRLKCVVIDDENVPQGFVLGVQHFVSDETRPISLKSFSTLLQCCKFALALLAPHVVGQAAGVTV
ncbi:MAG TPA: hypothetical protein DIC31_09425, partial [Rhizobiales bacterium]|nr:hypothetical protein [Hyphomicrobiales bacterium]